MYSHFNFLWSCFAALGDGALRGRHAEQGLNDIDLSAGTKTTETFGTGMSNFDMSQFCMFES